MNNLYVLKGKIQSLPFTPGFGAKTLRRKEDVTLSHVVALAEDIEALICDYEGFPRCPIDGFLVQVLYKDVVPKSRRIARLFREKGDPSLDSCVVGARFEKNGSSLCHAVVYLLSKDAVRKAASTLREFARYLPQTITNDDLSAIQAEAKRKYRGSSLLCGEVADLLCDCSNVSAISMPRSVKSVNPNAKTVVTFYHAGKKPLELLRELGLDVGVESLVGGDDYNVALDYWQIAEINRKAPYLIAMGESIHDENDFKDLPLGFGDPLPDLGKPTGAEPWIGVLDTGFNVQSELVTNGWVKVINCLPPELQSSSRALDDAFHGTAVTNLIVRGPELNPGPEGDDGCGRFRVLHCIVGDKGYVPVLNLLGRIAELVESHPEIHVWNMSIGSRGETDENFVSLVAAKLDELQRNNPNLLFVISGTNDSDNTKGKRVGSPADSINSLVVNSVGFDGRPALYSRHGPILSFYRKPDLSYYGGPWKSTFDDRVLQHHDGTSFAAPWIARKAAFLIDKANLSRNAAKALLIDSCLSFDNSQIDVPYLGNGIVPVPIAKVLESEPDEIRFLIEADAESFYTGTYLLPVPTVKEKYPFKVRAVLSFSSECSRNQGVDYTCEELSLQFGRMKKDGKIRSINKDAQDTDDAFTVEEDARALFRKWDNIKIVKETIKDRSRPVKKLSIPGFWGIKVAAKIRFQDKRREKIPFAVVVTLKEIYGQNRADAFEDLCLRAGWIVQRISVDIVNKIVVSAETDIRFDGE